jgi:hypothetical protein
VVGFTEEALLRRSLQIRRLNRLQRSPFFLKLFEVLLLFLLLCLLNSVVFVLLFDAFLVLVLITLAQPLVVLSLLHVLLFFLSLPKLKIVFSMLF